MPVRFRHQNINTLEELRTALKIDAILTEAQKNIKVVFI